MRPTMIFLFLSLTLIIDGCSDGKFSGAADRGDGNNSKYNFNTNDPGGNNPNGTNPDGSNTNGSNPDGSSDDKSNDNTPLACSASSKTTALAETKSIKNNSANQIMTYRIGLEGCDNQILKNARITTDLRAHFDEVKGAPYEIFDPDGKSLDKGIFQVVRGSDLFGNQGQYFFHWQSNSMDIPLKKQYIILKLDLSNLSLSPMEDPDFNKRPLVDIVVDSFFALNGADPVKLKLEVLAP